MTSVGTTRAGEHRTETVGVRVWILAIAVASVLLSQSVNFPAKSFMILACGLAVISEVGARARNLVELNLPVYLWLSMMCLSLLWSVRLEESIQANLLWAVGFILGYLCLRKGRQGRLATIVGSTIAVLANLAFQMLRPTEATTFLAGSEQWRGVMPHKQLLGLLAGVNLVLLIGELVEEHCLSRFTATLMLLPPVVVLYKSQSATATVALLGAAIFSSLFAYTGRHRVLKWSAVLATGIGTAFYFWGTQDDPASIIASVAGRNSSLTGRTEIWAQAIDVGMRRPWAGYGTNALWKGEGLGFHQGPLDPFSEGIRGVVGYGVSSAHGAIFEMFLGVGLIGLGIFAIVLIDVSLTIRKKFRMPSPGAFSYCIFALYVGLNFVSESYILYPVGSFMVSLIVFQPKTSVQLLLGPVSSDESIVLERAVLRA